ncbi:E3 ubiquitin-protein ligase TRIM45-like [Glandiceps talaboti]
MAATTGAEILDDIGEAFLCCTICMEQFTDPKILPCLHTFCQQCLFTLLNKKGSLECPCCSTPCPLPTGDVSKLTTNFFMNNSIEIYHRLKEFSKGGPIQCEGCQNTVTHRCVECRYYLCKSCLKVHRNLPSTNAHQLVTIEDYRTAESTRSTVIQTVECCSIHPTNEIEFYCDTCQASVCTDCTIVNHCIPQHVRRDLKDVADEYQKQLKDMVDKLKVKEQEAQKNKTLAMLTHIRIEKQWCEEERKVRMKAEDIIKKVKSEEKKLVDDLHRQYGMKLTSTAVDVDELESKHVNIKSTCSYIETILHHGNAVQLLSTKKAATDHIQQLITMETRHEPLHQMVQFEPRETFAEHGILGELVTSDVCISQCTVENIPEQLWKRDSANSLIPTSDFKGKHVIPGQEVKAKVKKPDGLPDIVKVTDTSNGTHGVAVHGNVDGKCQVTMTISDQPTPGSPVIIPVTIGLEKTIGSEGSGKGQYNEPYSVAITRDRDIVTADWGNKRLQVTTTDGRFKKNLTFTQFEKDYKPCDIAISNDNTYYSLDDSNKQVVVSDENGHVIRCFGQNELKDPYGLAVSPVDSKVYVTDRGQHCVRVYTQYGKYVGSLGSKGKGQAEFNCPYFLAVDSTGRVFVADCCNHRIQVFTDNYHFLYGFGCHGGKDGQLNSPRGVTIENNNRYVYVSDNHRVQKFDITGQCVRIDSDEDGLNSPQGIALTDDVPCRVVVVNWGNECLKVFAQ